MLVYRIEDKNKLRIGAFQGLGSPADFARAQARREGVFNPYEHPDPGCDCRRYPRRRQVCGFQSLEVYRIWFVTPGVRAALYQTGTHHMRVYEIPDDRVIVGMVQVLFDPDDAISVRVATPEEMA